MDVLSDSQAFFTVYGDGYLHLPITNAKPPHKPIEKPSLGVVERDIHFAILYTHHIIGVCTCIIRNTNILF